jgi:hypothetical protein
MGLAGNGRCCCCPCGRSAPCSCRSRTCAVRSNRHLHHRQTDAFASAVDRYAGERAISALSDDNTASRLAERSCAGPRANLFRGRIPVRVSKAGFEPALPVRSIRHLHHQRRLSREGCGKPNSRKFYRGAVDAPPIANPQGSLCHRYPAHRLVPSGRPRALGHAPLEREPRDPGLPFRPWPGCSNGPRGGQ